MRAPARIGLIAVAGCVALPALAVHTISGRDMISKFGYRRCP